MAIYINTNVNALLSRSYLAYNQDGLSQAMLRLSSGLRINSAADDPAGFAIATQLGATAASLLQGARNGNDGLSLINTAESAISNIQNLLTQMQTLATQASSGTYSSSQLANLNTEFTSLLTEVNRVAGSTSFNGVNLLDGSTASLSIQLGSGATVNDSINITLSNLTTGTSGLNIASLDISSASNAQSALNALTQLTSVTTAQANLGASEVTLTSAVINNNSIANSLLTAQSRIQNADFALEAANFAKFDILTQSNIAMLTQANANPQHVLWLFMKN